MKLHSPNCVLVLLMTALGSMALAAGERAAEPTPPNTFTSGLKARTDVNPALIYWQAFAARPEFTPEEEKLWQKHWETFPLGEEFTPLVERLEPSFKLFRRALQATAPCDWGYDLADGPELLLPGLAKAKNTAQQAAFRARYFLERGREDEAVQDLLAAFVLGRHVSGDGTLISALVQIAIENIVADFVALNFHHFSPESLRRISEGIEASPARGTIARSIQVDKEALYGWFAPKILQARLRHGGDEQQTMAEIRAVLVKTLTTEGTAEGRAPVADEIIAAAGGSSEGLLNYIEEGAKLYDDVILLANLPYEDFLQRIKGFNERIERQPNLFVKNLFPPLEKVRSREFAALNRLAMLQAAIDYRLTGEEALQHVRDPFGSGPFGFRRVNNHQGRQGRIVGSGFELSSELVNLSGPEKEKGKPMTMVFILQPPGAK